MESKFEIGDLVYKVAGINLIAAGKVCSVSVSKNTDFFGNSMITETVGVENEKGIVMRYGSEEIFKSRSDAVKSCIAKYEELIVAVERTIDDYRAKIEELKNQL